MDTNSSWRQRSLSLSPRPRVISALVLATLSMALGFERTRSRTIEPLETSVNSHHPKEGKLPDAGENRALSKEQRLKSYGQLPLAFEANQGQTDRQVQFISRGSGYGLFLTSTEAVLALRPPAKHSEDMRNGTALAPASVQTQGAVLRLKLVGANATPQVMGMEELPGKVNYFIGNEPDKWRTDIPTYAKVKYQGVYAGVDQIYYGDYGQLEYDLVVAPGADPDVIALRIEGSKAIRLNRQGDLELAGSKLVMRKPNIYQEIDGIRKAVQGEYKLQGPHQVGFQVGAYDTTRPLVIDPVLVYSTFLGGSQADAGSGIAVDGAGNAYVTGYTDGANFPMVNPVQATTSNTGNGSLNGFVAKLNPAGNALIYSTYLGGQGQDAGHAIAVDGGGNAYVTGSTASTTFPMVNPTQATHGGGVTDAFVVKLNATGNALIYSTYLGVIGYDDGNGIAVDGAGNAYVTGDTYFNTFPTVNPAQPTFGGTSDAFVVKFNAAGNALVYSTFLGGGNYDSGNSIVVDGAGNAYVTGWTLSTNFPTVAPAQATYGGGGSGDAFVAKLNAAGNAFAYATYLGGSGDDQGLGIGVDSAGNAFVTGWTKSTNFPTVAAYQANFGGGVTDAFVSKLNAAGTLSYSTYLGGSALDWANGIAVDGAGNAYVAGYSSSANFPTVSPLYSTLGGGQNAFAAKLDPPGTLNFSTYLGGTSTLGDQAYGIAVDGAGSIYLTGRTYSSNFPLVNPYQSTLSGSADAFVAKISIPSPCVDPPNTTMVVWYPFDETVGTTAANLATGNSGTLINSPTHVPGMVAGALRFDGINDYVNSPSTIVTNIGPAGLPQTCSGSYSTCGGDFSIDAWIQVNPTASLSAITITDKRSGSIPAIKGYNFFVYQRNKLGLQLADGVGSGYSNYLSPIITGLAGNWHHVAVTVSRRSPMGIKWYDNGVLIGSSDPTVGATRYGSLVNNSPLRIGADSWLGGWFKGDIDELEIFNRELGPAEVLGIKNAEASGKCK